MPCKDPLQQNLHTCFAWRRSWERGGHQCPHIPSLMRGPGAQGYDVKCGGTVRLLVDLELLAHSDYLVASDHSQWSRLLQYMRYILYGKTSGNTFHGYSHC